MENENLSLRMEQAVICLLLSREYAYYRVAGILREEMFDDPAMQFVYRAIASVYDRGEKADWLITEAEMRRLDEKRYQEIGGLNCMYRVMLDVRHEGNVVQYAEAVKQQFMLRRLSALFLTFHQKSNTNESDYKHVLEDAEHALLDLRKECLVGQPVRPIGEVAAEALALHRTRFEKGEDLSRILTGFDELDYVAGGFHSGELTILAGRPSEGKTALAMTIAMNVARSGKHVCFFSLEMTGLQTLNRLYAGYAGVDPEHLRIGGLTADDLTRMDRFGGELDDLPLYFDYTPGNSAENLRAQAMLLKRQGKCDFIIVDYLNEMAENRQQGDLLVHAVGRNAGALKQLAGETDCPVLALAQMNRESVHRHDTAHLPELHDARDSGMIEQVADGMIFIYIPERNGIVKDETTGADLRGVGRLYILKNRNGSTGFARYRFNKSFTSLTNYNPTLPAL